MGPKTQLGRDPESPKSQLRPGKFGTRVEKEQRRGRMVVRQDVPRVVQISDPVIPLSCLTSRTCTTHPHSNPLPGIYGVVRSPRSTSTYSGVGRRVVSGWDDWHGGVTEGMGRGGDVCGSEPLGRRGLRSVRTRREEGGRGGDGDSVVLWVGKRFIPSDKQRSGSEPD